MRIRSLSLLLCITMVFMLSACKSVGNSANNTTANTGTTNQKGANGTFKAPDISGEITDITGNEITLKIIKMPQQQQPGSSARPRGTQRPQTSPRPQTSGDPGTGNGGGMGQGTARTRTYTGEVKTIVIPVGTKLTSTSFGQGGTTETEVNINTLAKGTVLSIYYATDKKTIDKITVQIQRTGSGGNGRNNPND